MAKAKPEDRQNWERFDLDELSAVLKPISSSVRKEPKPHQEEAITAGIKELQPNKNDVRTTIKMCCGSGKTIVGREIAFELGNKIALVEPSLALIAQNLKAWKAQEKPGEKVEYLIVCSDETAGKLHQLNADEQHITKEELEQVAPVTNSPEEIAKFLAGGGKRALITTLHSSPLIEQAYKEHQKTPRIDVAVVDEAHHTATHAESAFTTILSQHAIPCSKRLFMTATPKIVVSDIEVASMDDEKLYGKICHDLPFGEAVERGILSEYQVVVSAISDLIPFYGHVLRVET